MRNGDPRSGHLEDRHRRLTECDEFSVGSWRATPKANLLSLGEKGIRVEPRVMQLLCCLAQACGRPVTRRDLIDQVWEGLSVSEDALNSAVFKLRRVLDQDPDRESYLETIPKVGYRLAVPVGDASWGQKPAGASRGRRIILALAGCAAALLLGATLVQYSLQSPPQDAGSRRIAPLTSFAGLEVDAAYGPGNRVAFAWNGPRQDNFDIYLMQPGQGVPTRLTRHPHADQEPAWSADGSRLAYLRFSGEECEIRLVSALGGGDRKVADCLSPGSDGLGWTPDGQALILSERRTPQEPFGVFRLQGPASRRQALTHPPQGSEGDFSAAFSPDGRWLAFLRSPILGVEDLWLQPASGGEPRQLTHDGLKIHGLDWSRDSRRILFASNRAGVFSLWSYSLKDGALRPLLGASHDLDAPSAAPDSDRLAYVAWDSQADISLLDLRSPSSSPEPVAQSTRWDWGPALSPDGARLAFISDRSGHPEVWLSDPRGGSPQRLTQLEGPLVDCLRWSPDGNRLAFETREGGGSSVLILEPGGDAPRPPAALGGRQLLPSWSRDGGWLYFASDHLGQWQIFKGPLDGSSAVQITSQGGLASQESWDGGWLYFTKKSQEGIWRMSSQGGEAQLVVPGFPVSDRYNWQVAGGAIYFPRRLAAGQTRLMSFDPDSGQMQEVARMGRLARHSALAISDDGRFAYLSLVTSLESDIMVMDRLPAMPLE